MDIRQADFNRLSNRLIGSNVPEKRKPETSFKDVLKSVEKTHMKFSSHAMKRIESRSMEFDEEELFRISVAMDKAELKGVKDAVILMENKILITNIPSRTIITTFNREQMTESIFTNIDGAIIA